jgi:Ca-activated chloride channel homolog
MKRRTVIRRLLLTGAAVPLVPRLFGGKPQEDQPGFTIHSDVRLVILDVSVKDRSGGFISGLKKEDFHVFENGAPQTITVFGHEDLPVTVGLLIDESQSMGPKRNEVLTAAGALIAESNPQDEIFVLNFNDVVHKGLPEDQPFSSNLDQLRAALYRGVPIGRTALYDAVYDGLTQLESGHRDKKALILISDGGDNASHRRRQEVYDKLDRSLATVYAIGLYDANDPDRSPGLLKRLAAVSGGEAFFPQSPAEMTNICRGIAKDVRTRFTVGYVPPASNGGPLRHIRVAVTSPSHGKLVVRTRTQYLYEGNINPGSK